MKKRLTGGQNYLREGDHPERDATWVTMAQEEPNITNRRETKAKLNPSPPTEGAVWHEVGLHLWGIKSDAQNHRNQSGNSWSDIKFNSMWDKEQGSLEIKLRNTTATLQHL